MLTALPLQVPAQLVDDERTANARIAAIDPRFTPAARAAEVSKIPDAADARQRRIADRLLADAQQDTARDLREIEAEITRERASRSAPECS